MHPRPAAEEINTERAVREGVIKSTVARVGEPIQAHAELLGELEDAGVVPGSPVELGEIGRAHV